MMFNPRPKGLGKDAFLKLSDKEEITGLFKGEIFTFKRHWVGNRGAECSGEDCPICKTDPENKPAFRFRVNFITTKEGQWIAKIFEGGGELYDDLTSLDKKFDLAKTIVEITRIGVKQNTKYRVLPMVKEPITKEMQDRINSVSLLRLSSEEMAPEASE